MMHTRKKSCNGRADRKKGFSASIACRAENIFIISMKYNLPVMEDIFSRWKTGLARSSKAAFGRLAGVFGATEITSGTWDLLEALLVQADLGLATTEAMPI